MIPKFRAWHKKDKRMIRIDWVDVTMERMGNHAIYNGIRFTEAILMQSTGLKDKNGVEIFEGDILHLGIDLGWHETRKTVVKWDAEYAHWYAECQDKPHTWTASTFKDGVVIGNIHENKELLK